MRINLSDITFDNDFYTITLNNGNLLVLNSVYEQVADSNGNVTEINKVNIEVRDYEGNYICLAPTVIGMTNDYFTLGTDYTEYEGAVLNVANMYYVYLEVEDE